MSNEIRAVLIPTAEDRKLLLPNAMVAEIMPLELSETYGGDEQWLLGYMSWRGWSLPVIDFAMLTDSDAKGSKKKAQNVAVLKSINTPEEQPYFAVVSSGIPKLQMISRGDMQMHESSKAHHNAIASLVSVHDETADIPNMNYLERRLMAFVKEA